MHNFFRGKRTKEMSALVLVDVQKDFLPPNGALAVPHGDQIIDPILELLDIEWNIVIATQDWHPKDHTSFASQHGVKPYSEIEFTHPLDESDATGNPKKMKQIVWPDHCIQESEGAEIERHVLEKFEVVDVANPIVKKGYLKDREYYSCFHDCWGIHHTEIEGYLKEHDIKEVIFVGLAYDFCVLNSARDCAALGYETYVVKNCSRPVYSDKLSETDRQYRDAGVKIINYDDSFPWKPSATYE